MIIGTFTYDQRTNSYQGAIVTLGFDYYDIAVTPTDQAGGKLPDYRLTAMTARAGEVELGAGWKRTTAMGRSYVAVTLDSPVLPAPLHTSLFTGEEGEAVLIWNRSRKHKPWSRDYV